MDDVMEMFEKGAKLLWGSSPANFSRVWVQGERRVMREEKEVITTQDEGFLLHLITLVYELPPYPLYCSWRSR